MNNVLSLQVLKVNAQLPRELGIPSPKVQTPKASCLAGSGIHCTSPYAFVLSSSANKVSACKQTAKKLADLLVAELHLEEGLSAQAINGHINFHSSRVESSAMAAANHIGCETPPLSSAVLEQRLFSPGKLTPSRVCKQVSWPQHITCCLVSCNTCNSMLQLESKTP